MPVSDRSQVLVVDDEPNIRDLLATVLRFHGFEVTTADRGATALDQARRSRPDVVVLDVGLPDLDGFEVCRLLREDGDAPGVVFLTARDDPQDTVTGLALGGDDYVTKPFVLDDDPAIKMFGLGLAVAVAVDATIVRGLLAPATMALMGAVTWWTPSRGPLAPRLLRPEAGRRARLVRRRLRTGQREARDGR